jgi:hypothetical protein
LFAVALLLFLLLDTLLIESHAYVEWRIVLLWGHVLMEHGLLMLLSHHLLLLLNGHLLLPSRCNLRFL